MESLAHKKGKFEFNTTLVRIELHPHVAWGIFIGTDFISYD
jgi:hypothetical protein